MSANRPAERDCALTVVGKSPTATFLRDDGIKFWRDAFAQNVDATKNVANANAETALSIFIRTNGQKLTASGGVKIVFHGAAMCAGKEKKELLS